MTIFMRITALPASKPSPQGGDIHALMAGRPGTVIILTARDAEDLPNIKGLRMTSG